MTRDYVTYPSPTSEVCKVNKGPVSYLKWKWTNLQEKKWNNVDDSKIVFQDTVKFLAKDLPMKAILV